MYHPVAYGLAISSVELPYLLAQSCIFAGIAYFMVGFARAPAPFFYFLLMFMAALTFFNTFGQFVVYITPNSQVAQVGGARPGDEAVMLLLCMRCLRCILRLWCYLRACAGDTGYWVME
jgi:hypothetical protein